MDQTQNATVQPLERFLRRAEVERITGLGRSTIYDKMAAGEFPKCVPLTGGAVGWRQSEIAAWQAERVAARDAAASASGVRGKLNS